MKCVDTLCSTTIHYVVSNQGDPDEQTQKQADPRTRCYLRGCSDRDIAVNRLPASTRRLLSGDDLSAFLASQRTYDYIASGLFIAAIRYDTDQYYPVRQFLAADNGDTAETLELTITRAILKLYNLNRLALVTRYGYKWDREDSFSPAISRAAKINLAQFIHCIACVLYQCSEYLTDETTTYKEWRYLEYQLAYSIFARSPEYRETKWDL